MSQVQSVSDIPCLYVYHYETGLKRYFVKTQIKNRVFRITLDLPDNPSKSDLRRHANRAISLLKKQSHNHRSFDSYIQEYIVVRQLSPKTAKAYVSILSHYSFDEEKNSEQIQKTIRSKINSCQITRTVNAFFNWLNQNNVHIVNPAANIKIPKSNIRTRTLSKRDIKSFYAELEKQDSETELFGRLLLETGARVSSIYAIKCGDLCSNGILLHNVKAGRDYRLPIPLKNDTRQLLERQIKDNPREMPLFCLSVHTLTTHLRQILDRLFNTNPYRERIVIHSLRHTAATLAIQNGVPIDVVSRMLDHVNINTTYHIYANLNQNQINRGYTALFKAF